MTEFTAIGRPTPLIDGRARVTGATRFAADRPLPGLLHARLVPSLYAHARIEAMDTAAALATPGVVAVLTASDLPAVVPSSRSRLLLARGRVIFAGQPVALVLATSEAAAQDGAQQVRVQYDPQPAAVTLDEALAEGAPLVWPDGVPSGENVSAGAHGADQGAAAEAGKQASNVSSAATQTRGDVAAGFAAADVIVERVFTTAMVHQSSLETHTVAAQPDPATGGLTVWSSTQAPFDVRQELAEVLGLPEADLRVIATPVGGGFGGKFGLYEPLVALAARALNRPVRLSLTRLEELLATNPAPATRLRVRLGARRDGGLTALEAEVQVDNGCYPFDIAGFFGYMLASFYRVPNFSVRGQDVLTFKPSAGAYRAPGAPCVIFALDSVMDEMAQRLGADPLEFRLRHAARPGDPLADGDPWPGMGMAEVLEALRDHPAWRERAQARARGRGVGIAVGGWMGGTEPAAAACALDRDGRLVVHIGSVDLTGTTTGFALLAAEAFGLPAEKVRVIIGDTATAPYSGATGGSKVTYTTGAAVVQAARAAREQTLAIAADLLEAAAEDLEIVDGLVRVRGAPGKTLKLADIARKTMRFGGQYAPVYAHGRVAETAHAPGFSAQLAEVEVDQETGVVQVRRLVVAQDVGRALNPLAIEGQMHGGAVQGLGWALYEQMGYDAQGQLLTGTWQDYMLPGSMEAPAIETVIVEVPSEHGPFGARGVGEAPVVPTAAAIANAIADATGRRLTDLPMTPARVCAALARPREGVSSGRSA